MPKFRISGLTNSDDVAHFNMRYAYVRSCIKALQDGIQYTACTAIFWEVRSPLTNKSKSHASVMLALLKVGCNLWGYYYKAAKCYNRFRFHDGWGDCRPSIQGQIAALDSQEGYFSFGEIHKYVVRGVNPEGFSKENKQVVSGRDPSSLLSDKRLTWLCRN